jgi:dTDP-4-dehydrorhamnose 3,5-epimerase
MQFEEGSVAGAFIMRPERRADDRGYFARIHCEKELADRKLEGGVCQINTGVSPRAGTLRGMHYQTGADAEVKIMRCVRGAAFDVVIDLRPDSPTFRKWFGAELTAESGLMLYAPAGTAHGYLTLVDDTELLYMTNKMYAPNSALGVRFDDPAFEVTWPRAARIISKPDQSWPLFVA